MDRQARIEYIRQNPEVTVLVVGAGINGIGAFRDLALQGIDVLLVERGDYCSGASAASSHMVHGGIRYLENGEFRLVREAVQERNRLIENAPHLVKPLPTTFPIFKLFSGLLNAPLKFLGLLDKPSERGALVIKIGMMLYDAYTRAQPTSSSSQANSLMKSAKRSSTVPPHKFLNREKSLAKFPKLNPEIKYTGTYYDGAMPSPERICIDLIEDAKCYTSEPIPLNYMSMESAAGDSVILRDEISGEQLTVKPKIVINAAGPWIDFANQKMGKETQFIGGTKGSHLILDHPELRAAIKDHEFFFENKDGRIVLIFPLMDKVMIGTSDIRIEHPDEAYCTEAEIEYFFEMIGRVFPTIQVDRSQVVFTFSGVRPLPYTPEGSTGQISRDHHVNVLEAGNGLSFPVFSLVGGKWTSFRAFSEVVADKTLEFLGKPRLKDTKSMAIGGGRRYPSTAAQADGLIFAISAANTVKAERVRLLYDRYGTKAEDIAGYITAGEDHPLGHLPSYSSGEIRYIAENEDVVHLDDLVLRRSLMAYLGEVTVALLDELAEIVGDVLGWSSEEKRQEVQRTKDIFADKHRVMLR